MRIGFFKYFLFHDPNWDPRTIDWDRDLAYAEAMERLHERYPADLEAQSFYALALLGTSKNRFREGPNMA